MAFFRIQPWQIVCTISLLLFSCEFGRDLETQQEILVEYGKGSYRITAITEDIIKISYRDDNFESNQDHAPILSGTIPFEVDKGLNCIIASTPKVSVRIIEDPLSIAFFDYEIKDDKLKTRSARYKEDTLVLPFKLQDREAIYGLGARGLPLNRRGNRLLNYNTQAWGNEMGTEVMNYALPHWMSSVVYMMLVDNPARSFIDIDSTSRDLMTYETAGGNINYYFINGGSFAELLFNYTELTGRQPMPPIWALGYLQSRNSYQSRQQTEQVVRDMKKAGFPMDAIILDLLWFSEHDAEKTMGDYDFKKKHWPDPAGMISDFEEQGIKTIVITEPFFTTNTPNFKELDERGLLGKDTNGESMIIKDFFWGETGLIDIFNPEAKSWLWDQYKRIIDYGVHGFWVDLNEPEVHPDSMLHVNGPAPFVHGIYGHEWCKNLYEKYTEEYPDQRLFQLTRSGYAGTQRYGVLPWSGDVKTSWEGLRAQSTVIQSMAISGLGYMHSDAGGYLGDENNPDPELYTRWMQYATFTPIFRSHSSGRVLPEPVYWNEEVQQNVKPFIELRYKLLPYNYTLAWKNSTTGMPPVVPLFTQYYKVSDTTMNEYLWGDSFLVVPVMEPGLDSMSFYLPEGGWYDYWTNEFIYGDQFMTVPLTMDKIPLYVKAGSIIPTIDPITSTDEYDPSMINLTYYAMPGESFTQVYFDDGLTPDAFEKGLYELVNFFVSWDEMGMEMAAFPEGNPQPHFYNINIVGLPEAPSNEIPGSYWDEENLILNVQSTLLEGLRVEG